ncbi:ATPase, T2SS/T4P/T4SS family [Alicyclobacillus sendaiensis PA2]|uniref:ATPase, T2SS/T4P/T4SS family n=2 Tax=Alicyclobacillus sendaiensis TaxID=192387 RepID=A0ABT6Y162_ALISE|nr:ATPase, T2SS/T4P/T4SS family [Alicyclobacillus sendaiensis PA2]
MFRLGPLQPLWARPDVSDIQIFVPYDSRHEQIIMYTDRKGRHLFTGRGFRNYTHARSWLDRHLAVLGQKYDRGLTPSLDATFPNGERLHVISGVSAYSRWRDGHYELVECMIISVRRFIQAFSLAELTQEEDIDTLTEEMALEVVVAQQRRVTARVVPTVTRYRGKMMDKATADYLRIMVQMGKNHLIAGGTGAGKSTLANALTAFLPPGTVLLVMEESYELQPQNDIHVIRICERKGVFTLADAMKAALRMFPDRLFVAEVRDALAYVFMRAIQSGHDGSSTTIHASDCASAIETMIQFAMAHEAHPPREMVEKIIFDRVHTVAHINRIEQDRFVDEVVELRPDGTLHTVSRFIQTGVEKGHPVGYWVFYGPSQDFLDEMARRGIPIPASWHVEVSDENHGIEEAVG